MKEDYYVGLISHLDSLTVPFDVRNAREKAHGLSGLVRRIFRITRDQTPLLGLNGNGEYRRVFVVGPTMKDYSREGGEEEVREMIREYCGIDYDDYRFVIPRSSSTIAVWVYLSEQGKKKRDAGLNTALKS